MTNVSDGFKRLALAAGRRVSCKIEIGYQIYSDDRIIEFELRDVAHENWFTIGDACPNEFSFTVEHYNEHSLHTVVRPFISFDGNEWMQLGEFYIARRYFRGRYAKIICFDKLYDLNVPLESIPADLWQNASTLLGEICSQAGLTFSGSCLPYPLQDYGVPVTVREMIGCIAALNCACARIDKLGRLVFKSYYAAPTAELSEQNVFKATINMTSAGIRGLRVNTGRGQIIAGDGTGLSQVDICNPFMNEETAQRLCAQLAPIRFYGGELKMQGLPYLEAGELMLFRGFDDSLTPIALSEIRLIYDGGLTAEIYSKNKFNSDSVVHRQEFESALAEIRALIQGGA